MSELAAQPDFCLGPVTISPSRRLLAGPAGTTNLEPIITQALLLLAERRGEVVTRNALFAQCWGAAAVGDDSLNRAVAKVRRSLDQVAPGAFEVETIPRTGYRLVWRSSEGAGSASTAAPPLLARRHLLIGGTAVAAALGGGVWLANRSPVDPRFTALMREGDEAVRDGSAFEWPSIVPMRSDRMIRLYEQAVRLDPGNARAWGLLSYYRGVNSLAITGAGAPSALKQVLDAAARARALDPAEPNARIALYIVNRNMLDWISRDRALRAVLADAPDNVPAMMQLMPFLQTAGLTRESWHWNERILAISPMARQYLVARAMKLWILGRNRDSDNVIDRVRSIWPDDPFAYSIRLMLFGLTGRPNAAIAMLGGPSARLAGVKASPAWRTALAALDNKTRQSRDMARNTLLSAARGNPQGVNDIVMLLGALGMVDEAFAVTEGYLLWKGRFVTSDHANGALVDDLNRRMTQWLFTPPLAAMRDDPRFISLCDQFGLSAYWQARGIEPDYRRFG